VTTPLPLDYKLEILGSGFLVVLRFDELYEKYAPRYQFTRDVYAIPRVDRSWTACPVKYRGTDRDALDNSEYSSVLAELFMEEIAAEGRCIDGLLRDSEDVREVLRLLEADAGRYEPIWVRQLGSRDNAPDGYRFLGIEASYFVGDHFSASCDCMMIRNLIR